MARRGLLNQVNPSDPTMAQMERNVRDAVERLTADDDLVQAPVVSLAAGGPIPSGATVVVYRGAGGQTLSLPLASARGGNTAAVVHVVNTASAAVTLARSGADTLNGAASLSLGAGKLALLVSDGAAIWKAITS